MGRPKATTLELDCVECGKLFTTPNTIRGRKKVTCSKSCASKLAYKSQKITLNCTCCGAETVSSKSVEGASLPVYCQECSTHRYTLSCESCGEDFRSKKYNNRFCSRSCETEGRRNNLVEVVCDGCGNNFTRPSFSVYRGKRSFCSDKCNNRLFSIENPSRYGGTWSTWLRKIRDRDNGECQKCFKSTDLQVHHFIKLTTFSNPNDAHYHDNLVLLCVDCHREIEDIGVVDLSDFYRRYSPTPRETVGEGQK